MIYQQYTTAIKDACTGADVIQDVAAATFCREWLESLEITPDIRDTLVEQITVLEETFLDLKIVSHAVGDEADLPDIQLKVCQRMENPQIMHVKPLQGAR